MSTPKHWVVVQGGLVSDSSEKVRVFDVDFMESDFVDEWEIEEAWNMLNDLQEIPALAGVAKEVEAWAVRTAKQRDLKICPSCGSLRPLADYPDWGYGKCEDCAL